MGRCLISTVSSAAGKGAAVPAEPRTVPSARSEPGRAAALEIAGLSLDEDVQLGDDLDAEVRQRLLERLLSEESAES